MEDGEDHVSEPMCAQGKDETTVELLATNEVVWSVVRSGLDETSRIDQDAWEEYNSSIAWLARNWKL